MTNQFSKLHQSNEPFFAPAPIPIPTVAIVQGVRNPAQTVETGPSLDFRYQVAFEIATVPDVQAVFTTEYARMFFVWIVVPNRDYDVYGRIFEIERSLIDRHTAVQFDFTIMPSNGSDPRTLVTDPQARLVYARD